MENELASIAREALQAAGLTQTQAAERLEVNQATISKALRDLTGRYSKVQSRIISLAGWKIDGPYWKIQK